VPAPQHQRAALTALATLASLDDHDVPARPGGKYSQTGVCTMTKFRDFSLERLNVPLKHEDARDAGEVDALFLAEALNLTQRSDVAQRVPSATTGAAAWHNQAHPIVLAQGLRMHAREFRSGGNEEDRLIHVGSLHVFLLCLPCGLLGGVLIELCSGVVLGGLQRKFLQ